jgi:hypothetical protein
MISHAYLQVGTSGTDAGRQKQYHSLVHVTLPIQHKPLRNHLFDADRSGQDKGNCSMRTKMDQGTAHKLYGRTYLIYAVCMYMYVGTSIRRGRRSGKRGVTAAERCKIARRRSAAEAYHAEVVRSAYHPSHTIPRSDECCTESGGDEVTMTQCEKRTNSFTRLTSIRVVCFRVEGFTNRRLPTVLY